MKEALKHVIWPIMGLSLIISLISSLLVKITAEYGIRFSTPNLSSSMIAATAVMSLYLAWKEFIHKNKVYLEYEWDFEDTNEDEKANLVLTNTSDRIIRLNYISFSFAYLDKRKNKEAIYFNNNRTEYFEEKALEPGESAKIEIAKNLILFDVKELPVRNWKGEKVEVQNNLLVFEKTLQRVQMAPANLGNDSLKIREIYDELDKVDHTVGTRFELSKIKNNSAEELISVFKD